MILYDTLIKELTDEEIVAVLAHEIGHYKRHHITWGLVVGLAQMGVVLWLFSLCVERPELSMALGGREATFELGFLVFMLLYSPVNFALDILMNIFSRRNELQADAFAVSSYDGAALVAGLKKISVRALSNLTPHPWYEFVYYSHPSLLRRIKAIDEISKVR